MLESAMRHRQLPISVTIGMNPKKPIKDGDNIISIDVFVFSVKMVSDTLLSYAKKIRALKSDAFIVFVTNASRSNIQRLVRPSVGLSGLLFIPPEKAALYQTINEIAEEKATIGNIDEVFSIKSGSEYRKISLHHILYFQSREKKIVLTTDKQEIEFYSSLTAVTEQIPDYFARCYKSYIVNTRFIAAVDVSQMEISLCNGFKIPLSRQYKSGFKNYIKEGDMVG